MQRAWASNRLVLSFLFLLAACTPAPSTSIPITAISQGSPLGDVPSQPLFTIVTTLEQWESLRDALPREAVDTGLRASQQGDVLVVVAFAGMRGSSGYQITITEISQQGNSLIITVLETTPGPDDIVEPATTLPYHLVLLPTSHLDPDSVRTYEFREEGGAVLTAGDIQTP